MGRLMIGVSGLRGIVGEDLHPLLVARWSCAFSAGLPPGPVVVGRDSRESGERFSCVAMDIFQSLGRAVWDLGIVPTPTVQMAVEHWGAAGGLILSASHNPGKWNALKFVGSDGSFLGPEPFAAMRRRAEEEPRGFLPFGRWGVRAPRGEESLRMHRGKVAEKIDAGRIRKREIRVLIDCVNGAGGVLLPDLLAELGAKVELVNGEPHGRFPRDPEPTGRALEELAAEARRRGVDFALAVDPDADRCALSLPDGKTVGEEWTLPLVAMHLMRRRRGPLVTNLSTSTRIEFAAERCGATVERVPVGEAHVVGAMRSAHAVLGGEGNGGVIDPDVHYGRDAAVAAAWLLEAHATHSGGLAALAAEFPSRVMRKAKVEIDPGRAPEAVLAALESDLGPADDRRDGLRWGRLDGFLHVRASGTEPVIRVIAEAGSEAEAEGLLNRVVSRVRPRDRE